LTCTNAIRIVITINGHLAQALLDSGSLGDFISSNLANQLNVQKVIHSSPINLQMAVQGSHSKVNYGACVCMVYQKINEDRHFDIINLSNYDVVLRTPFLYQHKVNFSIDPLVVVIGSPVTLPLKGDQVTKLLTNTMILEDERLKMICKELNQYTAKLCLKMANTPLLPLRDINHEIPLIDPEKQYSWCTSKCPEVFK
jgi:hypothetical protein